MQYVQMLMMWLGVDESTSALIMFKTLNITDEPVPTQPPPQPPMQQQQQQPQHSSSSRTSFAGLQRGFLTNSKPRPRHTNPNVPLACLHVRDTTGDPIALAIPDEEMRRHFEDIQKQVD